MERVLTKKQTKMLKFYCAISFLAGSLVTFWTIIVWDWLAN